MAPTVTPTAQPQLTYAEEPQPTTRAAGERLSPYYVAARLAFPSFPPTPQIDFDFAADEEGDAIFRGFSPSGSRSPPSVKLRVD